jgi:tetratricopeptide (TPR) repeat protein
MAMSSDLLIGRMALERGLLSEAQLAECLSDQRGTPQATLPVIMLRKGLIKQGDLDSLIEEHKKRLADALELSDPKLEDALLGRLLIKQGLVKEAQLYECLRSQAEMGEAGHKSPRLGEILVRKGFLSTDPGALPSPTPSRRDTFVCPSCNAHFSTAGTDASKKYTCKQCGGVLERQEKMGETTESLRIDMPEEAAKVAKDPKRQFAGGKYILIEEVGRGGMGIVWKAWQTDLRRYVAIKILVGTSWTDVEIKRFYREAQMAASLSHLNIASIYEVGSWENKHFISMEYVEGDSLARLMTPPSNKQGTQRAVKHLPPRRAIEIVREAALAAEYAHSKKIIHRDLKPHNIMVARADGRVYVMDFGLAKPIRSKDSITMSDAIVGTPQYMSPEQARGDEVDRRTDIFSLGAVLYHVLTGKPAFDGHSPAEVMMSVLADDPAPMRKLNPRIHADVETICLKALDKDRDRRYDSAQSLAEDLGRYLEGEPIGARPLSRRERAWKQIKRNPIHSVIVAAAVVALLLLGAIVGTMHYLRGTQVDQFIEEAQQFNREKKYEEAKAACERALGLDPGNPFAQREWEFAETQLLGIKKEREGSEYQKRRDIEKAFQDADLYMEAHKYTLALGAYERILALSPKDPVVHDKLDAVKEAILKEDELQGKVEDDYKKLLEDNIKKNQLIERQRQDRRSAFLLYEKARRAVEAAGHIRLEATGLTAADIRQRLQEARDALQEAIRKDPTYAEALVYRGEVMHMMGEYDLAETLFSDALKNSSDAGPASYGAAMATLAIYMIHRHSPEIPTLLVREDDPNLKRMGEWAEQVIKSNNPDSFQRWCANALKEFRDGRYPLALQNVKTVEHDGRAEYFYHFLTGCILLEGGDLRSAFAAFGASLELRPAAPEALFLHAVAAIRTQNLTGALDDANRAVETIPTDPSQPRPSIGFRHFLLRASIYHALGEEHRDKARADLMKAAHDAPSLASQIIALSSRWDKQANK